jgi:putative phage-type endonuclease
MANGTRLEPIARDEFTRHTGILLEPKVGVHSTHEFLAASFDGISEDNKLVLEIKCGKKSFEMALNGIIPPYYQCQIAHQLMVADGEYAYYYAFDGNDGVLLEVMRDREFEEKMLEEEIKFWNCVQCFIQPEV